MTLELAKNSPPKKQRLKWALIGLTTVFALLLIYRQPLILWALEAYIFREHPVPQIESERLQAALAQDESGYMLFDIRESEEYEMGHLKNAIHVSPDTSTDSFMDRFGPDIVDKNLIFYCSVGYRSSIYLEKTETKTLLAGASNVYNLKGGVFRWYSKGLPVFKGEKETHAIHPYNRFWEAALVSPSKREKP